MPPREPEKVQSEVCAYRIQSCAGQHWSMLLRIYTSDELRLYLSTHKPRHKVPFADLCDLQSRTCLQSSFQKVAIHSFQYGSNHCSVRKLSSNAQVCKQAQACLQAKVDQKSFLLRRFFCLNNSRGVVLLFGVCIASCGSQSRQYSNCSMPWP